MIPEMVPEAQMTESLSVDPLTKLYVEITSRCNLHCRICLLNDLNEPTGLMPFERFERLVEQVQAFPVKPWLHFAGYGEPTSHPRFLDMVRLAKEAGIRVGITTNGTLITQEMADALVRLQIDRVVVSIDGTDPDHYADIRLGSMLPQVIANMQGLNRARTRIAGRHALPVIGIAFVAMKRNVADLADLPALASRIGATEIIVSNLIPHNAQMEQEILYEHTMAQRSMHASRQLINLSLPKMDLTPQTGALLNQLYHSRTTLSLLDGDLAALTNHCRFVHDGYSAVRWDGQVSACLEFMHEHVEFVKGRPRKVHHHSLGSIDEQPLWDIWSSPDYVDFRQRVREFNFSPCTTCARCDMFSHGYEDCTEANPSPVCGGCLWAQGLIQCP